MKREHADKLSKLLEASDASLLPRLEPDPFLPARIRALAEASRGRRQRAGRWLRASFVGAGLALSVVCGVYLGSGLSAAGGPAGNGDSEILSAYYDAFTQSGFAVEMDDVLEIEEEESNEG